MISKFTAVILLTLLVAVLSADDHYTDKYDNVDLDEILSNQRLYKAYILCLLNQGKCTPDATELKKILPDAVKTDCSKCSPKQKKGTAKTLEFLITKKPDDYSKLEEMYDPTGAYRKKYAAQKKLAQEGKPISI